MAFKMKGFPQHKGISPMKKDTDPTVKGETKETVTVTDKKGHERGQDKLNRVKTQTQSMAEGNQAANLSKEYGGNWKQANNPNAPGSGKQWLNDEGETVRESATRQGQEYNKKKREYQAANTTKKRGAPKKTDPKDKRSDSEKKIQSKLDNRSSTYSHTPIDKSTVDAYRKTTKDGKDVNRTVSVSGDNTTRNTIHKDKQASHDDETKWLNKSLKGAKKARKKADRKKKREAKAAKSKAARDQYYKDNPNAFRGF